MTASLWGESAVGRITWCSFRERFTVKKSWHLRIEALGISSIDANSLHLLYKVWLIRLSSYIKTLNKCCMDRTSEFPSSSNPSA